MATYQLAWNPTTKVALIQADNAAVPGGSTDIGSFTHADVEPAATGKPENYEFDVNHVIYQHVRDLLYKQGWEDMQRVKIQLAGGVTL